ncbi:glycosyltransferase [Serratia sp. Se-PFBMAAmG]|nr:glycosyltransferase [Serratia sp. Se-PFBMAAmG]
MPKPNINATGVQFVRDHLKGFPRPDQEAANAIRTWSAERGQPLDPDRVEVVTFHYLPDGPRGYLASITQRMTLTQAVLANWQGESNNDLVGALFASPWAGTFPDGPVTFVETLPAPGQWHTGRRYEVYNGLFRIERSAHIDASTHVQVPAEAFQSFIWDLDLHSSYVAMLDRYWLQSVDSHRLSAKLAFITACNKQVQEGSLSDAARKLVWQAAGLSEEAPGLQACTLNIYGYASTDALLLSTAHSPRVVLYLAGNSSPLHEFASLDHLRDWVGEQCRDGDKRAALKRYFALADGPDGLDFSGLDEALIGLGTYPAIHHRSPQRAGFTTDGPWAPRQYVHYRPEHYSTPLTGDLFQAMAERHKTRSYADADFIITTDGEVTKARWRGYLNSAMNLLAPLALVVPELLVIVAAGGIAQFGLGLDQAINGKGAQQQATGVETLTYGLLNAAVLPAAAEQLRQLFTVKREGFLLLPSRVNDQWGYPLSPLDAPRLPELAVARYFHIPEDIAPLAGADEATAGAVIRTPRYDGRPDMLATSIGGYNEEVIYDMEQDAFITERDANDVSPQLYAARAGSTELRPVERGRPVTDIMRSVTLRALGVDLPLPLELPVEPTPGSLPIPETISCLWVGDKTIDTDLIGNLARNASLLKDSTYSYRLYLSNANPAAFAENLRLLGEGAADLQVLPLEKQPFYQAFSQSPYHQQYQAALDGNGGVATNFASASDTLRYYMLDQQGGIYMDVDDAILADGEHPHEIGGEPLGPPGEPIDQVPLLATPDGLLLPPPMSNEKMGMTCLYNTSIIGSHANNPTLKAILEEMHARFQASPGFYDSKPSLASDPAGFYRYASELSRLTGPRLLTDIIDRQLPSLYRLRHVYNLACLPKVNAWLRVNPEAVRQATRNLLPLNRIAKIGGSHSWART